MREAREKYVWIEKMKAEHSIELMCQALKLSRSGFYEWLGRSIPKRAERMELRGPILGEFRDSRKPMATAPFRMP